MLPYLYFLFKKLSTVRYPFLTLDGTTSMNTKGFEEGFSDFCKRNRHFFPTEIPTTTTTTTATAAATMINLKLLIDKSNKRVLYAEAGKDFVDFLFGLLELPVGAILKLLVERGMVRSWSIGKVYESVQNIDQTYFQTNQTKISLLNQKLTPSSNTRKNPMLLQFGCIGQQQPKVQQQNSFPGLSGGRTYTEPFSNPGPFNVNSVFASSTSYGGVSSVAPSIVTDPQPQVIDGFVAEKVTYMVMDDLTVEAMSSISSITILNRFKVRDVGCLEEKTIEVDMEMALKLVKASFESTTVLTDVFLGSSVEPN